MNPLNYKSFGTSSVILDDMRGLLEPIDASGGMLSPIKKSEFGIDLWWSVFLQDL